MRHSDVNKDDLAVVDTKINGNVKDDNITMFNNYLCVVCELAIDDLIDGQHHSLHIFILFQSIGKVLVLTELLLQLLLVDRVLLLGHEEHSAPVVHLLDDLSDQDDLLDGSTDVVPALESRTHATKFTSL